MHSIKKVLSVITASALVMGLTACGGGEVKSGSTDSGSASSAQTASTSSLEKPKNSLSSETLAAETGTINANVTIDCSSTHPISDKLFGIFLEDINHAVDGGMYAELIKNGSFNYGQAAANVKKHGWSAPEDMDFAVIDGSEDKSYLNKNNPDYAEIKNTTENLEGVTNRGHLDGIALKAGTYTASFFAKSSDYTGKVTVSLGDSGDYFSIARAESDDISKEWKKYTVSLSVDKEYSEDVNFTLSIGKGTVDIDSVSLMPDDTYKGLPVRKDIGEILANLHPSFLRFPGGCVIEGRSEQTMYSWKDSVGLADYHPEKGDKIPYFEINGKKTVGDVSTRPCGESIWRGTGNDPYYTTYGLGFFEYFELCEALNCEALPVVNAGMTCPIQSGDRYTVYDTNSAEFKQCIQDALDLAEFANGDAKSTKWGKIRALMGHKKPFNLKYIGIGNEQWQDEYHDHYELFAKAFEEARSKDPDVYGDIELCVANGPSSRDTYGYRYLDFHPDTVTGLVDEHFYELPSWFLRNTDKYDDYDRDMQAKVFLGEYAAKSNTLEAAIAEAAFMTGLERNGDVVEFACYAPLFGSMKNKQWDPDLIYFTNDGLMKTADYYVQQLYSIYRGTEYEETNVECDEKFTVFASTVRDEAGDIIIKLVNASDSQASMNLSIEGTEFSDFASDAEVTVLTGASKQTANTFASPDLIAPESGEKLSVSDAISYTAPANSFTVIKIEKN